MTAITPGSQPLLMTHMYSLPDLRKSGCPGGKYAYNPTSLMGILAGNPQFSRFTYIMKLAKFDGLYNDPQANFTLFAASDKALSNIPEYVFTNMDMSSARHLVKISTLAGIISSSLLEDSPASYFITTDRANKIYITNIRRTTYICNNIKVVHKDIEASNGMIHLVDGLIRPQFLK